jgi:hypothetical protein
MRNPYNKEAQKEYYQLVEANIKRPNIRFGEEGLWS